MTLRRFHFSRARGINIISFLYNLCYSNISCSYYLDILLVISKKVVNPSPSSVWTSDLSCTSVKVVLLFYTINTSYTTMSKSRARNTSLKTSTCILRSLFKRQQLITVLITVSNWIYDPV